MDLKNRKAVRTAAAQAVLNNPGNPKAVAGVYVATIVGICLLCSLMSLFLDHRIDQTGGLANMGLRSILSTVSSVLTMVQTLALMFIQLGYQKAALEMARHRPVQPRTMVVGVSCFGAFLRATILQYGLYTLLSILAMYAAAFVFMSTPLSRSFYDLMTPMLSDPNALSTAMSADSALFPQMAATLMPAIPIFLIFMGLLCIPFFYGYRMVNYCILNGRGARASMRESSRMMKGHRLELLKMDLSFWWFYLAHGLSTVILYGDVLLGMVGVVLPWSANVTYYLFYVLSLLVEGAVYYCFLNRVETTYTTVYNILRPKDPPTQGVVLGNIFDLAKDHHES